MDCGASIFKNNFHTSDVIEKRGMWREGAKQRGVVSMNYMLHILLRLGTGEDRKL